MTLPDLKRFDRFSVDTETTGLTRADRAVGIAIKTPDGQGHYLRWGHERGGNNTSLAEVREWARVEFAREDQAKVFFNAPFDLRMLAYDNIVEFPRLMPNVHDAGTSAALLDENEPSYSLDRLAEKHLGKKKEDEFLYEWCASQFGGKPWRSEQGKNIWRAPGNIVEPYAIGDVDLTLGLHDRNVALLGAQGLNRLYETERAVVSIVVRMHLAGVRVDPAKAEITNRGLLEELGVEKLKWMETAERAGFPMPPPDEWALPSTNQVAPVFKALGVPAVGKTALRTNAKGEPTGGNDSVTKELLESVADTYDEARNLLRIRELTKLSGTFVESYILNEADAEGLVHGEFHPTPVEYRPGKRYGTVSGRFSSWLHNVPGDRHPEAGRLVRDLFVPYDAEGEWVKADYSQIEYRFLGHYAGGVIQEAYNAPPVPGTCPACGKEHEDTDFHCMLTLLINRMDICNRRRTKNVNFAVVYGAGLEKGAQTAGLPVSEWKDVLATYHEKTEGAIKNLLKAADKRANARGYITTWGGRRCRFMTAADARKKGWSVRPSEMHVETYKALNRLLQGSAADLIKEAMVRIDRDLIDWKNTLMHLTVHDELDFTSRRGEQGATFRARLKDALETWGPADGLPTLNVPIRATIKTGSSWGAVI